MAARYTVKFVAGERKGSLLVLLPPSQPCAALIDAVRDRLAKSKTTAPHSELSEVDATLHLEEADGPELYAADLLSDVLPGAKETVVVVFQIAKDINPSLSHQDTPLSNGPALKLRVISPELARSTDISTIATLPQAISLSCTLRELKARVHEHLGFPPHDGACPELECNCSFVRQIGLNAVLNEPGATDSEALQTIMIVHGTNDVATARIQEPTLTAMQAAAGQYMSRPNKTLKVIGGISSDIVSGTGTGGTKRYAKLPVLAICSKDRHPTAVAVASATTQDRNLILDIHTSECSIELTSHNAEVTLAEANLSDCAVDGVLNIYAVQRWTAGRKESSRGKSAIFKFCEAWEHPHGQSDRGLSNFLSSLRLFAHLTGGGNMKDDRQDAVLHMIYLLTSFPPAVRAACILMRGETLPMPERAALAQCLFEVLKAIVPERVIHSDPKRYFEGSRLLFGLILEKAKNLKLSQLKDDASLPYINMRTHNLRNLITMAPVVSVPLQTTSGLVDQGFYRAFQPGGLLRWTNTNATKKLYSRDQDPAWHRVAILSGGLQTQVVGFNLDAVRSCSRYAASRDINQIISTAEYSELTYLAGLCSRNQLNVLPPTNLPSASPPVLTLDRRGSLAVYIGRAPCGQPGQDILFFRPSSATEEEGVDVSIITQLLQPILAQRHANGTAVFEAYGDHHRKLIAPEEITMLCVDLSRSMSGRCGFIDVQSNEDADIQLKRSMQEKESAHKEHAQEHPGFPLPDSDDLKEYLKGHESYEDFLAIVRSGRNDYERRVASEKVLQILQQVAEQEIEAKSEKLEKLRRQATHYYLRTKAEALERETHTLQNRCLRLKSNQNLLCAWFLTTVSDSDAGPDALTWRPGDEVPKVPTPFDPASYSGPHFELPREHCCNISSELMTDPVATVDGFTYERKNIERWFQTNETSPMTNLVLESLDLRADGEKKNEIDAFINGRDIIMRYSSVRGESGVLRVTIKSPLDTWSLLLPRNLKLSELWEIAFRLCKGRQSQFELQHQNMRLDPSQKAIASAINVDHTVFVVPLDLTSNSTQAGTMEEMSLVKLYNDSFDFITSYWEPKNTGRTLASTVFRYYRAKLSAKPRSRIEHPFVFWSKLHDSGDNFCTGSILEEPWEPLSTLFTPHYCTGKLADERCVDKQPEDREDDIDTPADSVSGGKAPLVLKLSLGKPARSAATLTRTLSRLDVLKQMFDAFVNRLLAYGFQAHLGLVTFGNKASLSQAITNVIEDFRHKLNHMVAAGDTALWDSIALALDQLQHYAAKYPKAKLRIICISDGEDNKSKQNVVNLASRLQRERVVVDSFCLGNASNEELKTLSHLTSGYVFEPSTLEEAMAICELEPVLSTLERPDEQQPDTNSHNGFGPREQFRMTPSHFQFLRAGRDIQVQRVTHDVFPRRKEKAQLSEDFIELGNFTAAASQSRTNGNSSSGRIFMEMRNSGAHRHPDYDVYICESNMALWKVVMQGPPDSTYAGGTFLLCIEMGDDYPVFAPTARFITPIHHPNINRHGRICHSILDRNWTVDTTNKDLIDNIYSLLLIPEFSDPINVVVTLNYHGDEVRFKEEVQRHIYKHASKSREQWRKEIVS